MSNYDEKLNDFINHVMNEAYQKKQDIEAEMDADRKKALEEKEMELLAVAYKQIQLARSKANKEASDRISKVTIEHKRALFKKREEIAAAVFANVRKRIDAYLQTPEYETFLMGRIQEALDRLGDGKKVLYIDRGDERFEAKIQQKFAQQNVEVRVSDVDLIGGCIVKNETSHMIVDDTLLERISESKSRFIIESGLKIS